jgi:SAM-dependent methyltransferase
VRRGAHAEGAGSTSRRGYGIDPHPHGRAPFRRLRAEEISTLGEQFDLVYTVHALHECSVPEQLVREAKEVLQPDGALVIMDWVPGARAGVRECYFAPQTVADCRPTPGSISCARRCTGRR